MQAHEGAEGGSVGEQDLAGGGGEVREGDNTDSRKEEEEWRGEFGEVIPVG